MSNSVDLPDPIEDELIFGYLGRVQILNGFDDVGETLSAIKSQQATASDRATTPALVYLARALRISDEQLASRHTMAPLFNTATRIDAHRPEWTPAQTALRKFGATKSAVYRFKAHSCPRCAEQDLDTDHGVGIWRRAHHVPGVQFCFRHGSRLYTHTDPRAFEQAPSPLDQSATPSEFQSELERRYATVCQYFLMNPSTQHVRGLRLRVLEHLHLRGVVSGPASAGNESVLPETWDFIRSRHLLPENRSLLDDSTIDFLEVATAYDATSYAMALSLTFASAADAIRFHQAPEPAVAKFVEGASHREFWRAKRATHAVLRAVPSNQGPTLTDIASDNTLIAAVRWDQDPQTARVGGGRQTAGPQSPA